LIKAAVRCCHHACRARQGRSAEVFVLGIFDRAGVQSYADTDGRITPRWGADRPLRVDRGQHR